MTRPRGEYPRIPTPDQKQSDPASATRAVIIGAGVVALIDPAGAPLGVWSFPRDHAVAVLVAAFYNGTRDQLVTS